MIELAPSDAWERDEPKVCDGCGKEIWNDIDWCEWRGYVLCDPCHHDTVTRRR